VTIHPQDVDCTGVIPITKESFVKREINSKKKNCFAVGTVKRVFFVYPDPDKPGKLLSTPPYFQGTQRSG
jgi:hypothetical protein